MKKELPKVYEPQEVESRIYETWEKNGCFKGRRDPKRKPFTIVMPPPNVTGQLHMGHAMDSTLQDILIRFKRMQGYAALWVPGTDHAGIATQIKVEEELRVKEGLTRYDLGRDKFLERVWDWKRQYGNRIVEQQKKLGVAAQKIYDFIWDDYCDWYIELTKTRLQGEDEDSKVRAQQVLCHVLTQMLKLLHPFMPFITEEIWQALPHEEGVEEGSFLMLQTWPEYQAELDFPAEAKAMELIMDAIRAVRTRRSEMNVPPSKKAHLTVATDEAAVFQLGVPFLKKMAYASEVTIVPAGQAAEAAGQVTVVTHAAQVSMPLAELVDLEKEKARLEKELKKNSAELEKLNAKLANPGFVNKAPEHVVKAEQERSVQLTELVAKLKDPLSGM